VNTQWRRYTGINTICAFATTALPPLADGTAAIAATVANPLLFVLPTAA
jgi:hypothetical protein